VVETIAALAAWTAVFDGGSRQDPPEKLQLLLELNRFGGLLREGSACWMQGMAGRHSRGTSVS
jgi:hypothetical protein